MKARTGMSYELVLKHLSVARGDREATNAVLFKLTQFDLKNLYTRIIMLERQNDSDQPWYHELAKIVRFELHVYPLRNQS